MLRQHLQKFLRRHIVLRHPLLKGLVEDTDILPFIIEAWLALKAFQDPVHLFRLDPVLSQLRDHGFHLADVAVFLHTSSEKGQLFLVLHGAATDHQIFSGLLEDPPPVRPQVLQNPEGQTLKAQHINI